MRKIFTFLCAALMSVGMWAEPITVTWNNDDISGSGNSFTKDGVTLTCGMNIDWDDKTFLDGGTFTTNLGNFTQIVVTAVDCGISGEGWSGNDAQQTWTGNAASVSYSGVIMNLMRIVFTIEPAGDPEPAKERVIFGVNVPANGKPESIELVGSFIEGGWDNGIVLTASETGWYISYEVYATADDEFKIRATGTWNNEIYVRTETGWTATQNIKFGDVWVDDTYKGDPVKWIELDLSGDNYGWKTAVQSIENIELTEKAKKVVVDGVIYIVRDGKLFNLTGAQVK